MDNLEEILMLTYLWPIVPYASCESKIIIIELPLLKSLDPVLVIKISFPPEPLLMLTYLWPVVCVKNLKKSTENLPKTNKRKLLDQLTPLETKRICQEATVPSPKKACINSRRGIKRKFEGTNLDTNEAKKIKMIQERIIKTMTINLCNDEKVMEHVNRQFSPVQTRTYAETKISPSKDLPLVKSMDQESSPSKPLQMITYLWP